MFVLVDPRSAETARPSPKTSSPSSAVQTRATVISHVSLLAVEEAPLEGSMQACCLNDEAATSPAGWPTLAAGPRTSGLTRRAPRQPEPLQREGVDGDDHAGTRHRDGADLGPQ